MKAVVLMKQVPDVRRGSVGLKADGTIDRAGAPAITNPADLHALEAALQLADDVTAISMGPPTAEAVLREALSLGADEGILLCDRAFAGSDTWATANVLAAGIRHIGNFDVVVCGMTALDGETGQVGPQVAERLDVPQATGCEQVELQDEMLRVRRIVEGGYELTLLPLPALLTISETGFTPRYGTLPDRRRAARAEIARLGAANISMDASQVGLAASPTKVARMEAVPVSKSDCRFVDEGFGYEALLREFQARGAIAAPGQPRERVAARTAGAAAGPVPDATGPEIMAETTADFKGDPALWVVCELGEDGALATVSGELISKAVELAPDLGGGVGAVVLAADAAIASREAATFGADVVLAAEDRELHQYRCGPYARVLADAIRARRPTGILFGATTTGRDLAARVAARLNTGLAADCTDLAVGSWSRGSETYDRLLHFVRPAMAGGVLATCVCPTARPQMGTIRPGTFPAIQHPRSLRVEPLAASIDPLDLSVQVVDRQIATAEVSLADADVIVAGGAGCDTGSWHLVEELAGVLGGNVAASRGAVEAGLAPRSLQVGQTGTTVRPRLYIACGISGAIQHAVGMRGAETIIAVNRDPDAYIFSLADFGIVGTVADVLPQLTNILRAVKP